MARKRSSRRQTRSKNGCLSGCLSAIFGLIGALVKALVAVIAGLVQLLASIVKWLSQQKITLPVGEGYQVSGLLVSLFFCFLCMCGSMTYVWTDRQLRTIGLLPTYTPHPTATNTPAPTATSTLTETPLPADTPPPPLPTETPTELPPTETPALKPVVSATESAVNLRNGPSTDYEVIGTLSPGESLEIVGRNADSSWFQVSTPSGLAWVAASVVTANNVDDSIPVVEAPPPIVQPTDTPVPPVDTPVPPTDTPPPPPLAEAQVVIVAVNKQDEYVDIQNIGGAPQDLTGWHLLSEKGSQDCPLSGVIQPSEVLRIWAMSKDADKGGFNCGFGTYIWNNQEHDPAVLYDATGREVDRKER